MGMNTRCSTCSGNRQLHLLHVRLGTDGFLKARGQGNLGGEWRLGIIPQNEAIVDVEEAAADSEHLVLEVAVAGALQQTMTTEGMS